MTGHPWVSYSHELPVTRLFWATFLGKSFDADIRLVAEDLRSVTTAVQLGMGASLVPDYACQRLLAEGSIVQLCDVTGSITAEPIYCSLRRADAAHTDLNVLIGMLRGAS